MPAWVARGGFCLGPAWCECLGSRLIARIARGQPWPRVLSRCEYPCVSFVALWQPCHVFESSPALQLVCRYARLAYGLFPARTVVSGEQLLRELVLEISRHVPPFPARRLDHANGADRGQRGTHRYNGRNSGAEERQCQEQETAAPPRVGPDPHDLIVVKPAFAAMACMGLDDAPTPSPRPVQAEGARTPGRA